MAMSIQRSRLSQESLDANDAAVLRVLEMRMAATCAKSGERMFADASPEVLSELVETGIAESDGSLRNQFIETLVMTEERLREMLGPLIERFVVEQMEHHDIQLGRYKVVGEGDGESE